MPSRRRPFGRKAWFPQPGSVWGSGCSLRSPTNPRSVSPGWGSGLISWAGPGLGGLRGSGQQGSSRHSRGPAALGRRLALLVGLAATWGGGAGAGRRTVFPLWDPGRPGSEVGSGARGTGPRSRSPVRRAGARSAPDSGWGASGQAPVSATSGRRVFVSLGAAIASSAPAGLPWYGAFGVGGPETHASPRKIGSSFSTEADTVGRPVGPNTRLIRGGGVLGLQPTSRLITLGSSAPPCPRRTERAGGSSMRFSHGSGAYSPLLLSG